METKESTRIIDNEMTAFTERFMLPDRVSHSTEMPWMPFADGCLFKPLRFDLTTGQWIMLFKVEKGKVLSRHRHTGGFVTGYVIDGKWHYLEKDWEAGKQR